MRPSRTALLMAVYTDVSDEALAAFLADYALGDLVAFRGITEGVENSNFFLRTTSGDFILTLYERRVDPEELPWFLGLMRHLATQGVTCPQPVAGLDGIALRTLAGRQAAITTFLPGIWPRRVRLEHCRPLGEALARLHTAGASYKAIRQNRLGPTAWPRLLESCRQQGDQVSKGLVAELEQALDHILPNWPETLPCGQIHADLFPDNVFFLPSESGQVVSGVIDFYFACTDLLAYDLAICLNAWCFDTNHHGLGIVYNERKAHLLVAGYQEIRQLEPVEQASLPLLAQGAAIRFLLTRLYDWTNTPEGAIVSRKDPLDYLNRLRFFQQAGAKELGI